jgi:holo-[acyl-carrier protein] synthase
MEALGVGTDIIEISRIGEVLKRNNRFGKRVFTPAELEYCVGKRHCEVHLAGRFAAKEAIAKALGKSLSWQDVEIVRIETGRPEAVLHGHAKELLGNNRILISIAHSRYYATAVAVLTAGDE